MPKPIRLPSWFNVPHGSRLVISHDEIKGTGTAVSSLWKDDTMDHYEKLTGALTIKKPNMYSTLTAIAFTANAETTVSVTFSLLKPNGKKRQPHREILTAKKPTTRQIVLSLATPKH